MCSKSYRFIKAVLIHKYLHKIIQKFSKTAFASSFIPFFFVRIFEFLKFLTFHYFVIKTGTCLLTIIQQFYDSLKKFYLPGQYSQFFSVAVNPRVLDPRPYVLFDLDSPNMARLWCNEHARNGLTLLFRAHAIIWRPSIVRPFTHSVNIHKRRPVCSAHSVNP